MASNSRASRENRAQMRPTTHEVVEQGALFPRASSGESRVPFDSSSLFVSSRHAVFFADAFADDFDDGCVDDDTFADVETASNVCAGIATTRAEMRTPYIAAGG